MLLISNTVESVEARCNGLMFLDDPENEGTYVENGGVYGGIIEELDEVEAGVAKFWGAAKGPALKRSAGLT